MKGAFFRSSGASHRLQNYFTQGKAPKQKQWVKSDISTIRVRINRDVANNGLALDEETLRDGNCGIDAVVRGLGRLEQKSQMVQAVLALLERSGRLPVIDYLRKLAIAYLKDHLADEFLQGVSIEDQILMDYGSVDEFTTKMLIPKEWIDATVLLGLAGALEIQIVIFTGADDPWVVSTNTLTAQNAPLVPVANVHNYHFWSLYPVEAEVYPSTYVAKDASDKKNALLPHLLEKKILENDEGQGQPDEVSHMKFNRQTDDSTDIAPHVKYASRQQQLDQLSAECAHLLTWEPFPDKISMEGLNHVDSPDSALVLKWREVLKPDSCSSKVICSASLSIRLCLSLSVCLYVPGLQSDEDGGA